MRNFALRTNIISTKINQSSLDQPVRPGSYLSQKVQTMAAQLKEPKFKVQDIVYIVPLPSRTPSPEWPALNSEFEIDCKVLDVYETHDGRKTRRYGVIAGNGRHLDDLSESMLVHAKDKHLYGADGFKTLKEDTELCMAGTVFTKVGDYYGNEILGIHIHVDRMKEITNLFK